MNNLGFVDPVNGFGHGVIIRIANTADRGGKTGLTEPPGIEY